MTTFNVSKVKMRTQKLGGFDAKDSIQMLTKKPVEACGASISGKLVKQYHPINCLLSAMHMAFKDHYPLTLAPDDVWLTIVQGLALHVDNNAEKLRKRFVKHNDKITLEYDSNFTKGSPDNDWPSSFKWFSGKIQEHIGKKHALIVSDFSTTGPVERAVSEIVLMDVVKHFFDFRVMTLCGIPEITLLGSVEDWKSIRTRAEALSEFGLSWWTDHLLPVLDQFVAAANGRVNQEFWTSLYHWHDGSGGERISGHVSALFPYLQDHRMQTYTVQNDFKYGRNPSDFSLGISIVPFVWKHLGTEYEMDFLGGVVGVSQDPDSFAVRPALGWAVRDRPKK